MYFEFFLISSLVLVIIISRPVQERIQFRVNEDKPPVPKVAVIVYGVPRSISFTVESIQHNILSNSKYFCITSYFQTLSLTRAPESMIFS